MPSSPFPPFLVGVGLFIAIPLIGMAGMITLIVLAVIANRRRGRGTGPQRPMVAQPLPGLEGEPCPPAWYLAMLNQQQEGHPPIAPPAHQHHNHPQPHSHQPAAPMHMPIASPAAHTPMHTPMHTPPPAPPAAMHH